ncbi:MAG: cytochrome c-type biogenesis protein CcmH [Roseovarius sp.]|nr:cytochrome c-type biogenesis protein CcmH [Roseovarius sp.]
MRLVLAFVLALTAAPLWAGRLVGEDPAEARVRAVATGLRCPVCQSENILDSHSGTAREMLELVREQVIEGRSDAQIMAFFRARYGDYVLLSPPSTGPGAVIWLVPVLLVIGGAGLALLLVYRLRGPGKDTPETHAQLTEARLEELEP